MRDRMRLWGDVEVVSPASVRENSREALRATLKHYAGSVGTHTGRRTRK
ncbi:MAG: hypothetical protein ABI585_11370 [Betaproteobacteria bacterium]